MSTTIDVEKLRIVHYPDPVLRKTCRPVEAFDESLRRFVDRMFELMRLGRGIGLAAPQVGVDRRVIVCNPTGEPQDDCVLINPELSGGQGADLLEEGCLSLPGLSISVRRATRIHVKAFDLKGQPFERDGEDLLARVWQHENDHLDGRMIIDYMTDVARIANRRALRQLEDDYKKRRSA